MEVKKPIGVAKKRRQLYPSYFEMGPVTVLVVSIILLSLMSLLYLAQLSQTTSFTFRLAKLDSQQQVLQRQNEALHYQIAQLESLNRIERQAVKMGMIHPASVRYIQITPLNSNQGINVQGTPISKAAK